MHTPSLIQRWWHKKTVHRYFTALEKGDIQTLMRVLYQATHDAVLEELLFERHRTSQTEEDLQATLPTKSALDTPNAPLPVPSDQSERVANHIHAEQRPRHLRFQDVALVLLLCLLVDSFLFLQTWRAHTPPSFARVPAGLCLVSGVPFTAGSGAFNAIAAPSANTVWVVGQAANEPLIEQWNGRQWQAIQGRSSVAQPGTLYSVSASSSHDAWAVGVLSSQFSDGPFPAMRALPLIEHWDGHHWSLVTSPTVTGTLGYGLNSVVAIAVDDVWAVGYRENLPDGSTSLLVEHWDGRQWQVEPLSFGLADGVFTSIAAVAHNDVWAVGYTGDAGSGKTHPLIAHWDGHQWNLIPSPKEYPVGSFTSGGLLTSISGSSATDLWTTGLFNYLAHWDGLQWKTVPNPGMGSGPNRVYAVSANDLWLAGGQRPGPLAPASIPVLEHWNGTSWQTVPQPPTATGSLTDITIVNGKLWAIGATNRDGSPHVPFIESNTCP